MGKKKTPWTNIEKVDRNNKIVAFMDGKTDGKKHSLRETAKKFNLRSSSTVFEIYKRLKAKKKVTKK